MISGIFHIIFYLFLTVFAQNPGEGEYLSPVTNANSGVVLAGNSENIPLASGEKEQEDRSRTEVIVMLKLKIAQFAGFTETSFTCESTARLALDALILCSGNLPPPSGSC